MDERIAKLRTSTEARTLAKNAQRRGVPELEAQAQQRANELKAVEEGYTSPAQQAIAIALYAYEEERTRLQGSAFRANRTRQMLRRRGALAAAERMVLSHPSSQGFEVLEEAGLQELSFEAIITRFPDEFSAAAVEAARARLEGRPPPRRVKLKIPEREKNNEQAPRPPAVFDAEAVSFLDDFRNPGGWIQANWLPRYRKTVEDIARALSEGRPERVFETVWKTPDNHISHASRGLLEYKTVDGMSEEFLQVIRDIHHDSSPANFERIVERFEGWRAEGRLRMVPGLMIARAFAGVHPDRYHTTVDAVKQNQALAWFVEHTGFVIPSDSGWAARAQRLVDHLNRSGLFEGDILARNLFPWFVVEKIRAHSVTAAIPPGHTPRPAAAYAHLPPEERRIALRHNTVQTALFDHLVAEFGSDNVWTEYPTGTGGKADAIVRRPDGRCLLYEIKIAASPAEVVRQAMGQLLEYGFRQGGLEPIKLWVVGEPLLDDTTRRFLTRLRADFRLDIDYLRINPPPDASLPSEGH